MQSTTLLERPTKNDIMVEYNAISPWVSVICHTISFSLFLYLLINSSINWIGPAVAFLVVSCSYHLFRLHNYLKYCKIEKYYGQTSEKIWKLYDDIVKSSGGKHSYQLGDVQISKWNVDHLFPDGIDAEIIEYAFKMSDEYITQSCEEKLRKKYDRQREYVKERLEKM